MWLTGLTLDILKMVSWAHMGRTVNIIIKGTIHIFASIGKIVRILLMGQRNRERWLILEIWRYLFYCFQNVWSEDGRVLKHMTAIQDFVHSCQKRTLIEVLDFIQKELLPVRDRGCKLKFYLFNSLAPGRCGCHFKSVVIKCILWLWIKVMNISCKITFICQRTSPNEKSALV